MPFLIVDPKDPWNEAAYCDDDAEVRQCIKQRFPKGEMPTVYRIGENVTDWFRPGPYTGSLYSGDFGFLEEEKF